MHRNQCLSLLVMVAMSLAIGGLAPGRAQAQQPAIPRLDVPLEATVPLQMSNKQKIKAVRSENPTIATINIKVDDFSMALVRGVKPGTTRVVLTDNNQNDEVFDVYVGKTSEQLRQEFLTLVRKAVPTSMVDVIPSGATTILTGTVPNPETVQVIMEIARGLFAGSSVINGMTIAGVQQVQLDVVVAVVNRSEARNIGFNFLESGNQHFLSSTVGNTGLTGVGTPNNLITANAMSVLSPAGLVQGVPNAIFGIANDNQGFFGFLGALRNENLIKILAEPRVVTLSGRPAYFVDGGEVPIVTSSSGGSNVSYKPFGTTINFLPIVLGNGKIHLEVQPQISTPNTNLTLTVGGISPVSAPGFDTRGVRVAVQMEDGQTLVIGGLIQNRVNASTNKVVWLGDLPFIGSAFRSVSYREDEEELMILVTPHLIDPLACNQIPKNLPGQETRSPDDFELFLEGILEAPRGPRVVCFPGYRPAFQNNGGPGGVMAPGMPGLNGQGISPMPVIPAQGVPESLPVPQLVRPATFQGGAGTQERITPLPLSPEGGLSPGEFPRPAPLEKLR